VRVSGLSDISIELMRNFTDIIKFTSGILTFILFVTISGCVPDAEPAGPVEIPLPANSLLLATPLVEVIDDNTIPPPVPERRTLQNSRLHCWRIPYEPPRIRFPVDFRDKAHLSFRLGAKTRVSIHIGDLIIRVEYVPDTLPPDFIDDDPENPVETGVPVVLWQTTPVDSPMIFSDWHHVDISLDKYAPGTGELRFVLDGPLAGSPGLDVLFGQPAIFYPDEIRNKNILLIGVDTLRADSLSPYGADPRITPNLSSMAENGVLFEQVRSQAPWTLPSFASMLTGRLASEIGSTIYTGYLPDRNITISEFLLERGYTTATICSNTWLGNEQSGFEQGVEEMWFEYNAEAAESVEVAKNFIARSSGRDWFCFLHLMDPHVPYAPPEEFVNLLTDPGYDGEIGEVFGAIEDWKSGTVIPEQKDIERARNLYLGEVADVDKSVGNLLDYLEENGLLENTLVIFSADHGEEFFEHDGFEHGHTHYDELVHMPLIIGGTGFSGGLRVDDSLGNTDIYPTILEYIGFDLPADLAGVPLQDVVAGDVENTRFTYGEDNSRGTHRKFCVQWPYKCILDFVTGEIRLYNLESDPGEFENLYESEPELAETLANAIALRMRPEESAFHIWITRSYEEPTQIFEGEISMPGGFKSVEGFMLVEGDTYAVQGNTVTYRISSSTELLGPNKHIVIVPNDDSDTLEASVMVGGKIQPDRFYPYGTREASTNGSATVTLDEFAAGPNLPLAIEEYPAACYIWGVQGFAGETDPIDLDDEAKDALSAIGYF